VAVGAALVEAAASEAVGLAGVQVTVASVALTEVVEVALVEAAASEAVALAEAQDAVVSEARAEVVEVALVEATASETVALAGAQGAVVSEALIATLAAELIRDVRLRASAARVLAESVRERAADKLDEVRSVIQVRRIGVVINSLPPTAVSSMASWGCRRTRVFTAPDRLA
jgi:hypothetical protein